MSVEKLGPGEIARAYSQQTEVSKAGEARRSDASKAKRAGAQGRDEVSISEEARSLAAALNAVKAASDVREEKVAAIKQRVDDGTYTVSPHALAHKILKEIAD